MEGAVMLMLLAGFLAFIAYRMDENEKKYSKKEDSLSDEYIRGYMDATRNRGEEPIDVTPISKHIIRKRKK